MGSLSGKVAVITGASSRGGKKSDAEVRDGDLSAALRPSIALDRVPDQDPDARVVGQEASGGCRTDPAGGSCDREHGISSSYVVARELNLR